MILNIKGAACYLNASLLALAVLFMKIPENLQDVERIKDFAIVALLFLAIEIIGYSWKSTANNMPGLTSQLEFPKTNSKRKHFHKVNKEEKKEEKKKGKRRQNK